MTVAVAGVERASVSLGDAPPAELTGEEAPPAALAPRPALPADWPLEALSDVDG